MSVSVSEVLRTAWQDFLYGIQVFLPQLLAMLSLVIVGWVIAWLLSFVLRHVLRWVRFDALADRVGATAVLSRTALPRASLVVSSLAFWLVWSAFMLSGLAALGFSGMDRLSADFVAFIPRLAVGIVILAVGWVAANFAWRASLLAAVNSQLPSPGLLAGSIRGLIVVLSAAMALEQVGVAKTIMLTAFAIAFGAIMLGVAIAVGIGGAPLARRALEHRFSEPGRSEEDGHDEPSHL